MMQFVQRFRSDKRGNVAITFALSAIAIFAFTAAAVDYSRFTGTRTKLQSAADGAALAGLQAATATASMTLAEAKQKASDAALATAKTQYPGVMFKSFEAVLSDSRDLVTINAAVAERHAFYNFTGQTEHQIAVTSKAQAYVPRVPVCLLAMEPSGTGINFRGSGSFKGLDCAVWSNSSSGTSSIKFENSSSIAAKAICANGKIEYRGTNTVSPTPEQYCGTVPDPLASWALPSYSTSCTYYDYDQSGVTSLNPGTYCGDDDDDDSHNTTTIRGTNITLNPGVYVFKDTRLDLNVSGTLTGTNVQFIMLGNSKLDIGAGGDLKLTAPADASGKKVLVAQAGTVSAVTHTFQGSTTLFLDGSIHVPSQNIHVTHNGALIVSQPDHSIVAKSITVGGSGKIEFKGRDQVTPPKLVNGLTPGIRLSQ
jgi:Flp pilus assembly protein TadG